MDAVDAAADVVAAPDVRADVSVAAPDVVAQDLVEDVAPSVDLAEEIAEPAGPYGGFVGSGEYIRDMLGVSTHMSRGVAYSWKREVELDRLQELGFTRVRSDFYWKEIEREEGVYDVSGPSHMTDLCLERGFTVLGILLIPPPWARTDGTDDSVDPEKWRAYVRYTVGEMGDRVHSWEIWNEQNLGVFWKPTPNPERFGLFLRIAAEEIRALHPDAEIVFGGLSPFQFHAGNTWGYVLDVAEFYPDLCDQFDSLAIHPYSFMQQLSPEDQFEQGPYVHPPMGGLIDEARTVLDEIGCPGRPIHLTETGWPDYHMGVETQGAFSARGILLAAAAGASTHYWYTFWDSTIAPNEPLPTECTFGLMTVPSSADEPGEKKPSFHALKGVSTLLGGTRYAGDLAAQLAWEEPHHHALAFVDYDGQFTLAVWHSLDELDEEVSLEIPLPEGATTWTRYDQAGAEVETGAAGPISVPASGHMTYLELR